MADVEDRVASQRPFHRRHQQATARCAKGVGNRRDFVERYGGDFDRLGHLGEAAHRVFALALSQQAEQPARDIGAFGSIARDLREDLIGVARKATLDIALRLIVVEAQLRSIRGAPALAPTVASARAA